MWLPVTPSDANPLGQAKWLTVPAESYNNSGAWWIWALPEGLRSGKADAPVGTVHLTRTWTLKGKPTAAPLVFAADNSCLVKINGIEVGKCDDWASPQRIDAAKNLKEGDNLIEVTAVNGPGIVGANPAGLLFIGKAQFADGTTQSLVSDRSWRSPDGAVVEIAKPKSPPWNLADPDVPCPVFIKRFAPSGPVRSARLRIVGLGHFDLLVNGSRQNRGFASQPWSQYDKTIYWQEFDVTKALKKGQNWLGVELGNSFYRVAQPPQGRYVKGDAMPDYSQGRPFLLAATLDLTYDDGKVQQLSTDETWQWKPGPYSLSHVYAGEDFDARWKGWGEKADWKAPLVAEPPKAALRPMDWPDFRGVQTWKPTRIESPKPGAWSIVFPQNASAVLRFRVRGKAGQRVNFRPSEVISPEGEVQQLNLWGGEASCAYTLKGGAAEEHEWRFFYHGFQFVEMTGAVPAGKPNPEGLPVLESIEMVHVRADNPLVGSFNTSKPLYNQTHDLVDWAIRSNMGYVMTDCPHREKLGWLECSHLLFSSFAYRYDAKDWFHKITRDVREIQLPDGRVTTVAPDYLMLPPENPYKFTIEWGATVVLLPWQAYQWYGDKQFLTENYDAMKRFVAWIDEHAKNGLAPEGLGDWYDYGHGQPPGPSRFTPTSLTSTAMWALCAQAMVGTSEALSKTEDAARYRHMHAKIKEAFLKAFYDPVTKTLRNTGSVQSGHAMALCADLIPSQDRQAVLDAIVKELEARNWQQTPGDVGHLFFIRALAEGGRSDVLHKVYSRTGVGSYGGILAKGLTTLPETWDAITVGSNSLNHCMLGHVMEWFYGWVLGIRQVPTGVGWDRLLIAPEPGTLGSAAGQTQTRHGVVESAWNQSGGVFTLSVKIPAGAKAMLVSPWARSGVTLDGRKVEAVNGPFGRPAVEVGPGSHQLVAKATSG